MKNVCCRYNPAAAMITFNAGTVLAAYLVHTSIAGASAVGDEVNFSAATYVANRDYSFGAVVTSGALT